MTCSNHGRRRAGCPPKTEPAAVKRYVHPICSAPAAGGGCQMMEAVLEALERQNALLETLCRCLAGRDGQNL